MGYTGNWLDDAYRIAPLSHAGRTAFLTTFGQTDAVAPGCRRNAVYNTLIEHDEPALRAHAADSVVLHRSLAEAYADVISMAMGRDTGTIFMQQINERYEGFPQSPSGQTDLDTLRAAVPRAQRLGFAHARAALELSHDPVDRAAMWHLMFRLAAGIPGQIRHFCMDVI